MFQKPPENSTASLSSWIMLTWTDSIFHCCFFGRNSPSVETFVKAARVWFLLHFVLLHHAASYLFFLYVSTKKMALHWLNVYVSFGFWQLEQNPLDLNFFTKLGRAYFLRTLYLYYNFHDVFKKVLMFRVMFINWKESLEVELFLRTVLRLCTFSSDHCPYLMVSSARAAIPFCARFVRSVPHALHLLSHIYWMSIQKQR